MMSPPGNAPLRPMTRRKRALALKEQLMKLYPENRTILEYDDLYQLLVAVQLSAQCTDERVNQVTPELFSRVPDWEAMANIDRKDLERLIFSTGYYRAKARNLQNAAQIILQNHGGQVPGTMSELLQIPGVARKTANVILEEWYRKSEGITVDTHVLRLSKRMGLTREASAIKVERDLMKALPKREWLGFAHLLVLHGRAYCTARSPQCQSCPLLNLCPRRGLPKLSDKNLAKESKDL